MFHDFSNIDISKLHKEINKIFIKDNESFLSNGNNLNYFYLSKILRRKNIIHHYFQLFLYKTGLYRKAAQLGIIDDYLKDFYKYWINELNGRPIEIHSFHYLRNELRKKFQSLETLESESDGNLFLEPWQNPITIYLLFGAVYKYGCMPFSYFPFRKWIHNKDNILEYGCGVAPFTTSLIRAGYECSYTLADIPQINFHYAKWLLKNSNKKVRFVDIVPYKRTKLNEDYDVIVLLTVLEHLPDPYEVIQNLTNQLKPGGRLLFDYILSDGDGLDSMAGLKERRKVLEFIEKNFQICKGKIMYDESMGRTIARKI